MKSRNHALTLATLGMMLTLSACALTRQSRGVDTSGFLGSYAGLREGGSGEAQLVYINSRTNFASYDKVLVEPVTIWAGADSDVAKLPEEDRQLLVDYLDESLRNSLSQDYAIVDRPGPGVMRVRVAITEAKGSKVALDTVSTVVPQLRVLTTVGGLATDVQTFVGRAGVEAELQDSLTEERLAAAVDRRAGNKALRGVTSKWSDVQAAFDHWSERLRTRLGELRAR